MTILRTLAHATILLALLLVLGALVPSDVSPGLHALLLVLRTGYGIPFALTTACVLNGQRLLLVALLATLVLLTWPLTIQAMAQASIPVAAGLITGAVAHRVRLDATTTPTNLPAPVPSERSAYVLPPQDEWTGEPLRRTEPASRHWRHRAPVVDADRRQ